MLFGLMTAYTSDPPPPRMPSAAVQTVERIGLGDISWDFYERLLSELGHSPGTRVTYDNGLLQIKVISAAHDRPNRTLASIVEIVAEKIGVDVTNEGSITLQRSDLLKGFEPDSRFYLRHAAEMRGVAEVWRLADGVVKMYALRDGAYQQIDNSIALPVLTAEAVTNFVNAGRRTMWPVWARELREWVRSR